MKAGNLEGKRILIAEDSWHVAHALKLTVEGEGGEVVGPVPTVTRACDLLARSAVDLAIVDLNLRDETAHPLIEALAARGIKAVLMSGYARPGDFDASEVKVLGKPVEPRKLLATMRRALSGRA